MTVISGNTLDIRDHSEIGEFSVLLLDLCIQVVGSDLTLKGTLVVGGENYQLATLQGLDSV